MVGIKLTKTQCAKVQKYREQAKKEFGIYYLVGTVQKNYEDGNAIVMLHDDYFICKAIPVNIGNKIQKLIKRSK